MLENWCKILRLTHWTFEVEWALAGDMNGACASIHYNTNHNHATVRLVKPDHLHSRDQDVHSSLVHELMHLFCHGIREYKGTAKREAEEVLCNRLSEALVALARDVVDGS